MDRGIWATWYNLPDAGRDDYLAWLQGSYPPQMLKRPDKLWAAHNGSLSDDKVRGRTSSHSTRQYLI